MLEIESVKIVPAYYGQSTGSLQIKAKSPNLPILFTLDNGISNNKGFFRGLKGGFYTCTILDASGNECEVEIEINSVASPVQQEYLDNLEAEGTVTGALRKTKAPKTKIITDVDGKEKEVTVSLSRNTLKDWRKCELFALAEEEARAIGIENRVDECEYIVSKLARGGLKIEKVTVIDSPNGKVIKTEISRTLPSLPASKLILGRSDKAGSKSSNEGTITGTFSYIGLAPDLMQEDE